MTIVGLPDAAVNLRKEGPAYDLPIALGILAATDHIHADISRTVFLGELSLDGGVRHTTGILTPYIQCTM